MTPVERAAPRRVALDVSAVPARVTGAGVYTFELARALAVCDGIELSLISRRADAARWAALSPFSLHAVAPDSRAGRLVFGELGLGRALARPSAAELLHAPHYTMPRRSPVPVVVTVHDLTLIEHPEWHQRSKVLFFRRAIGLAARHATRIICPSEHTAARLLARFDLDVPVEVIPHGVDHSRFVANEPVAGADEEVLRRLGITARYVLHLGTLEPRKNLPLLVEAFDMVAVREDDLSLVLAGGPGWGNAELDAAIARARHGQRVARLGYVAADDVPALLRSAAVVAYPSKEEGFGIPALEALACGAPLVTTTDTAMAELAGEAAWCCSPDDAHDLAEGIDAALASGGKRRALGIDRAANFTWEASARRHLEVYGLALS